MTEILLPMQKKQLMKGDHLFTDHNVTYPNKPPESDTSLNSECLQRAYMTPNRHLTPNFPQINTKSGMKEVATTLSRVFPFV